MTNTSNDKERWDALLDAISDDIANMPDELVLREYAQTVDEDVSKVCAIIHNLIGDVEISPYDVTKSELARRKRETKQASIPDTPEKRRSLIARILAGDHLWSDSATLAFRDLGDPSSLTDEEIQDILEDIAELNEDDKA